MLTNNDKENQNSHEKQEETEFYSTLIYRYQFSVEFMENMYQFSKIHQYDDRNDFKEAWKQWSETNEEEIHREINVLTDQGYRGDIQEKMFKSARYYFRKKPTTIKEPKKKQTYTGTNKQLLEKMDQYILQEKDKVKPSDSFLHFCEENKDLLKQEIIYLISNGFKEKEVIENKIKKTYKNRYFILVKKTNK